MTNIDRYLKIVNWARNRYTVNNALIVSAGSVPSVYSRIESAAFRKYFY